ncbi:MAG: fused MFS/spermidine synthase, partial [Gammaproteobacteria bacterium]|nr:fused MFS/spermidine synthase [Gammaproteobacteria bacterium]
MTGGLLILVALGYFVGFKRKWVFLSFLLLPMFALQTHTPVNKVMDNGTRVSEILSTESFYGSIKVVDYTYGKQHIRDLMIDGMRQGGVDMQTGLPIYDYAYLMEFLPYAMNSTGKDALVVGLGAGMIPLWYERQGIKTDVVEIDPVIAEVTKNYFDFSISGKVNISDARYYFLSTEKKYDYIVLDVFNGDLTPGHLISLEAFELAKRVMNEGGVFSLNLIANIGNEAYMTASVVKTLEQVFDNVDLYGTASLREGSNSNAGNLILLAYDGEQRNADISTLSHLDIYPGVRSDVESSLTHQVELPRQRAIVLTDDYNPMDFFDSGAREEVRLSILRNSEPDLLFN